MTLTPSQAVLEALHDYKARIPKREGRPDASEMEHIAVLEEAARRCESTDLAIQAAQDYCWQRYKGRDPLNLSSPAVFTSHEWQKIGEYIGARLAPPEGMNQEER